LFILSTLKPLNTPSTTAQCKHVALCYVDPLPSFSAHSLAVCFNIIVHFKDNVYVGTGNNFTVCVCVTYNTLLFNPRI